VTAVLTASGLPDAILRGGISTLRHHGAPPGHRALLPLESATPRPGAQVPAWSAVALVDNGPMSEVVLVCASGARLHRVTLTREPAWRADGTFDRQVEASGLFAHGRAQVADHSSHFRALLTANEI